MAHSKVSPLVLALACGILFSCSTASRPDAKNPVTELRDTSRSTQRRIEALDKAWTAGGPGTADRQIVRDAMKDVVWDYSSPTDLRLKIMGKLLDSQDPEEAKDARDLARLMLPPERSRTMVALISDVAGSRGWADFIPALVRSYSHPVPEVKDNLRSERVALETLCKGKPIEQAVFELFVNPPVDEPDSDATRSSDLATPQERLRTDAWDLLGRLDSDGTKRLAFVADLASRGVPPKDKVLECLQACYQELRCVPITGDELKWALALRSAKKPARAAENTAWWTEAVAAIRKTDPAATGPLSLRYAEPLRWAAVNRPAWLSTSREELKSQLLSRLAGREHNVRSNETPALGRPYAESIQAWDDKLSWGDFLTLLVIDEAMQEPTFPPQMLRHAELDRRDETTEYGGMIRAADQSESPAKFTAVLFPPRPGQRQGDTQFIASDDMISASDRSLAHYHFHAQSAGNRIFAGPSSADILYARRMGRTCVVLTTIADSALGIDYYQPNGAVIDLGVIKGANPR